ncbi:MAG TPA: formate dehydrogenase accessory sulfurtransferase FdhD [Bryobacteraceae bacterium]|nr:formate dehydrogenase accessory sulfurtransferase FdhD [Bryobacteraceae bacterium]
MSQTFRTRVLRFSGDAEPQELTDELAVEEPLEIRIGGQPVSVTMRTPGNDLELAAGLLVSEGIIPPQVKPLLRQEGPNIVNLASNPEASDAVWRLQRVSISNASCGVCGKASLDRIRREFAPLTDNLVMQRPTIARIVSALEAAQPAFVRTGGIHAAGLFSASGEVLVVHEDIGRHNAVDKCVGHAMLRRLLPLSSFALAVSGRASFEIVQKAVAAGIPIIAAVSAPSSLAVEVAEESGLTLAGFVRPGRCNVYTHPHRLVG